MKAHLRKLIGATALGLALFSQGLPVWAGLQSRPEVTITSNSASGTMAGARYSTDTTQNIGCTFDTTVNPRVTCSARDKNNLVYTCSSTHPAWVKVVKTINDASLITFAADAAGTCTKLIVENHSSHLR